MYQQPYQGMPVEGQPNNEQHLKDMHDACTQYHLHFIQIQMIDGSIHDGIIEDSDNEGVTLLMPEDDDAQQPYNEQQGYQMNNQPGHFGYGYGGSGYPAPGFGPGYGPGYGIGRPRIPRRFRRFRRRRYPFYGINTLLFPFFI
ncbi:hypothetical protein ACM26V_09575 [Salipaludibacillus sp. HK11]|uniref:hypothetical protein n=1 Tax=Salipaludibacillus sp. HK11 TaxID=3394320 RepID=UPI0039FDCD1F